MERIIENNQVTIAGKIVGNFEFSHEIYGEGFYVAQLESKRKSENSDIIPIMASERLIDVSADWIGQNVKFSGNFRSYNKLDGEKKKCVLSVFVRECEVLEGDEESEPDDINNVFLDGYICKQPIYRQTPMGREITDLLLAVNRPYGKSDYIPCICWGRSARFAEHLPVGTRMKVRGRVQSREYYKKLSEDEYEPRIAYELSIRSMEIVEKTEE